MPGFEAVEGNLWQMLAVFGRALPAGCTRTWPGLLACSSALDFAMFNCASLTAPIETPGALNERIETAAAWYASMRLPWSFWLCEDWLPKPMRAHIGDIFGRYGMHLVVELPGMESDGLAPPVRPLPVLDFRRVSDRTTRADFSHIMTAAFGISPFHSRPIYESEKTWEAAIVGWVAYREDAAVATTLTLAGAGTVGVYAVGTLPHQQRRGYGEAVMRHALERARAESGFGRTVLESSDAGFELYRRMGYRTVTRYSVFALG